MKFMSMTVYWSFRLWVMQEIPGKKEQAEEKLTEYFAELRAYLECREPNVVAKWDEMAKSQDVTLRVVETESGSECSFEFGVPWRIAEKKKKMRKNRSSVLRR